MCYVGKATKIFIFLITVLLITALIFGFGFLRRAVHPKSHKCSGESCSQSDLYPPPPLPAPEFTIPSTPDPNASIPPPPPPPSSSSESATNLSPPPPPSPPPPVSVLKTSPPPPLSLAPPPAFNPPSPVPVTPGPVNNS